jgi:L-alanine-DL-glutamate epimerase-like enolase superfamily enzyme
MLSQKDERAACNRPHLPENGFRHRTPVEGSGAVVGSKNWDIAHQWGVREPEKGNANSYSMTKHPFTRVQITDKGLEVIQEYVGKVRDAIGYDVPLASDHFGHFDVNTAIRLGKAVEKFQLAWLEDVVPWNYTEQWKQITDAINTPTLTGEDIYLKENFIKLIDARAIDMIHPDLASSGGLLETRRLAIMRKNAESPWLCISPERRFLSWQMFIARRLPKIL